ncbi:MAG: hypothetical protein CMC70_01080 [Flavobacteriaceae bacterium]|nr:hypothetical protein [Flavobacteriaceae bacterium]|tara:strand:+ start:210 stop:803 length:594 start_codon:yes stop_codon:yes gene_type:complete
MEEPNFGRPIPGNSLTTHKPGDRPWERPPEMSTVEETLRYYFKMLNNPDVIDDLMTLLDMGVPIRPIVQSIYTSGVMNGMHSLDVGLIIEDTMSEFLATVAKSYEIDFTFTEEDPANSKEAKNERRTTMMLQAAIERGEAQGEDDEGVQLLKQMAETIEAEEEATQEEETPMPVEEEQQQEEMPIPEGAGLMSRGGM